MKENHIFKCFCCERGTLLKKSTPLDLNISPNNPFHNKNFKKTKMEEKNG